MPLPPPPAGKNGLDSPDVVGPRRKLPPRHSWLMSRTGEPPAIAAVTSPVVSQQRASPLEWRQLGLNVGRRILAHVRRAVLSGGWRREGHSHGARRAR